MRNMKSCSPRGNCYSKKRFLLPCIKSLWGNNSEYLINLLAQMLMSYPLDLLMMAGSNLRTGSLSMIACIFRKSQWLYRPPQMIQLRCFLSNVANFLSSSNIKYFQLISMTSLHQSSNKIFKESKKLLHSTKIIQKSLLNTLQANDLLIYLYRCNMTNDKQKAISQFRIYYVMNQRNQNKYYRIIEDNIRYASKIDEKMPNDLKDIISTISNNHKYIYIDINEQRGFKMMEECKESDSQSQVEQVGTNFIANLNHSSNDNKKSITYLLKLKEINRQKELTFRLLEDQIKKSQLKLRKKKSLFLDEALTAHNKKAQRRRIYNGMDAKLLQQYQNNSELDSIDQEIKQRQARLLNNYSTIPTHRSNQNAPSDLIQKKNKKKSLFPILTQSINSFTFQ